jgi:hypothetical protein
MDIQQLPIDIQQKIKQHYKELIIKPYFNLWKYKTPEPCIWNPYIRKCRLTFENTKRKKNIDEFILFLYQQLIREQAFPLPGIDSFLTFNMGFYYLLDVDFENNIYKEVKYYMED